MNLLKKDYFNKKVENYKLRKLWKNFKTMFNNGWKNYKDDIEIQKYKFYQHKSPILTDNIDINKIVVSNRVSFGQKDFKYFVGYKDAKKS